MASLLDLLSQNPDVLKLLQGNSQFTMPPDTAQDTPNNINIAQAANPPDVSVDNQGNSSDGLTKADTSNSNGTSSSAPVQQASDNQDNPLSNLLPAITQASASPSASKGLLGSFADTLSGVGDKISSLSPEQSQGLLAASLQLLANNNGTQNFAQALGSAGITGLNAYSSATENRQRNTLANAKLQQEAQDNALNRSLKIAEFNQKVAEGQKPIAVASDANLYDPKTKSFIPNPNAGQTVASWQDVQGADGKTYKQAFNKQGEKIGEPQLVKDVTTQPLVMTPEKLAEKIDENNGAISSAQSTVSQYRDLAERLKGNPNANNSGAYNSAKDKFNNFVGNTDVHAALSQEFAQARTVSTKSLLPAGAASDRDVARIDSTAPGDNASDAAKANWLTQRADFIERANNRAADANLFLQSSRGSGTTLADITLSNGAVVPAGTSQAQFNKLVFNGSSSNNNTSNSKPSDAPAANSALAKVQAAAKAGDTKAQAELKARGYTY